MEEFLLGENYVLAANAIKILLPGRILAGIPEKSFFLGGIPASTDFSAGFLPRYAAGIFPGKDPAGKTGHLGGIPVSAGNLDGIPARSRYLFYKGNPLTPVPSGCDECDVGLCSTSDIVTGTCMFD